jgi:hypothetical protein
VAASPAAPEAAAAEGARLAARLRALPPARIAAAAETLGPIAARLARLRDAMAERARLPRR